MTKPSDNRAPQSWDPPTVVLVAITAAFAALVFTGLGVAQLVGIVNAHNNFARMKAPGEKVVWVSTPGRNAVWLERDPKRPVSPGTMTVAITSIATGAELPMFPRNTTDRYATFGRDGKTIGEVLIPERGQYAIIARGGGGNNVAIGKVPPTRWYVWAWIWFGLAGAALLTAIITSVLAWRARYVGSVEGDDLVPVNATVNEGK